MLSDDSMKVGSREDSALNASDEIFEKQRKLWIWNSRASWRLCRIWSLYEKLSEMAARERARARGRGRTEERHKETKKDSNPEESSAPQSLQSSPAPSTRPHAVPPKEKSCFQNACLHRILIEHANTHLCSRFETVVQCVIKIGKLFQNQPTQHFAYFFLQQENAYAIHWSTRLW